MFINEFYQNREVRRMQDRIHIRFYTEQASVRARYIDNKYLYLGWYVFGPEDNDPARISSLFGHANPMIFVERGTKAWEILQNFFVSMSLYRLWLTSYTPEELVRKERDGPYSDWLHEWVYTQNKSDVDAREQFIESVSDTEDFETEFGVEIRDDGDVDDTEKKSLYEDLLANGYDIDLDFEGFQRASDADLDIRSRK
jgi:hypothetical protein